MPAANPTDPALTKLTPDKLDAKLNAPEPSVVNTVFAAPSEMPKSVNTLGASVIPYPAIVVGLLVILVNGNSKSTASQVKPVH